MSSDSSRDAPSEASHDPGELATFLRELEAVAHSRSLFATLRRIDSFSTDTPGLGRSGRPKEDPVRLGQKATMAFATSQIAEVEPARGQVPPSVHIFGPGMFGPNGALPVHLTEYTLDRKRNHDDPTLWRFVNLFHHRLLSLLYRAWANAQPAVSADRPDDDRFTGYVASLMGMGLPSLRDRAAIADHGAFHYVGHFARQSKSPQGLMAVLRDFFDVPVRIEQFVGEWLRVPDDARWRLGRSLLAGALGESATLGARVWGCQHKFRITIGPMDFASFQRFLPGEPSRERLVALVRGYCSEEFDFELNVILQKDDVPALSLGHAGQLGRTSWLATAQRDRDADDVVFASMMGESRIPTAA